MGVNSIALSTKFLPLLDEAYKMGSKFGDLDLDASMIRETMSANVVRIPNVSLQGLGAYSKSAGYVDSVATLAWETHTFTQDRARTFNTDAMDDEEALGAFAMLSGQFVRTQVVPEIDAYRAAVLATAAGNGTSLTAGATLSASTALQAFDTAVKDLQDDEVDPSNCNLYITPEVEVYFKQSNLLTRYINAQGDGTINRATYTIDGIPVIVVPPTRMYSAITLYDGSTSGQEAGSYVKGGSAKDLNFLLVDKNSAWGIVKTAKPRIFDPETNQAANAWKFDYRIYHDMFVPTNKANGIYRHNKA